MAYDKNIASGTIFDEIGYDEMQKRENHEIGFKLFRVMFFLALVFSLVLVIVCGSANDTAGMVISIILMATVYGFYVIYAAMTAKKGIMNPKFAKSWSGSWVIVAYAVLGALWVYKLVNNLNKDSELSDIANCIVWLILILSSVLLSLCAKKNNKVLKEQLKDDEQE